MLAGVAPALHHAGLLWEVEGDPDALFVAPVAGPTLSGPVLEEISLARDEQANVAWLIERIGFDPVGGRLDLRLAGPPPSVPVTTPPPPAGTPVPPRRWRLTGSVPDGWRLLLPGVDAQSNPRLDVGRVVGPAPPPARSRLLTEIAATGLPLSVVSADGIVIRRRAEAARWTGGVGTSGSPASA